MLVSEPVGMTTDEQPMKIKRRSIVMRDINKKLKKIKRQVGSFDTPDPPVLTRNGRSLSLPSDGEDNSSSDSLGFIAPTDTNGSIIEEEFLDIIYRLQGNRINDQRSEMPAALLKHQNLKFDSSPPTTTTNNVVKEEKEPITEVLALGAPYPMVVLPVDGEYWMEGTYHILSRDMNNDRPIFPSIDLSRCTLDEDTSVYNYRCSFSGNEHMNFVGTDTNHGHVLMSILLDNQSASTTLSDEQKDNYKVILRLKDKTIDKMIPTSTFPTDHPGPRDFMKNMLKDEIDVLRFHPVAIPRASDDIMKFDEHCVSNCYKIGVIHQKHGQVSEEEFLQNQGESPALREFMDLIGSRVELKDFPNYRGGLDVKHGQTGDYSYYTNFKEREIMFHVSTLIPYTPNDPQQLNRKRHIGNDVVSIVFQEENTPFCPSSIRSHFLHCFIVVQVENPNTDNTHYKVSVAAKEGVPKFAPSLPNPCIFKKGEDFRNFLLTKVLNAENAAVKSEKFSALAERTRSMLLQGLVSDFISKNEKILEDETFQNGEPNGINHSKTGSILSTFRSALNRSSRNEHDTTSISSTSSNGTTNLNSTKRIGHSLSLNDLNTVDGIEEERKDSVASSPGRKHKKEKEKHKKDKAKSGSSSNILAASSSSKAETEGGRLSPCTRSRYYTNKLFEKTEALEAAKTTAAERKTLHLQPKAHSLPRNGKFCTMNTDRHSPSEKPQPSPSPEPLLQIVQGSTQTKNENEDQINNNTNSNQTDEKLESAQLEIERLRAEINKLKIDKMDLVRQNVIHQREIKKLNERLLPSSHTSNELRRLSLRTSYDPRRVYNATATTFAEFV